MVDQALEYKSLLNKVDIMINNVNKLGMNTKKYKEILKEITNEVESSTKVSKSKWENNASMVLICDYALGIKKLRALELELSEYEVYFKVINSCEYLLMKIDKIKTIDNKEEVKSYANEIIESLKSIKFSSTIHYSDEKKIVEKIYDVAYKIIQLEIMTFGNSEVYEYIKNCDIDIYFLDRCIRKDIELLNLKDESNKKVKEKVYELSRNGLDTNYFDIELIKLLMCNSDDINLKDNIIKEINNLKKEINDVVKKYNESLSGYKYSVEEQKCRLTKIKKYKKEILRRITSTIVSSSIVVGSFFGIHTLMKKISTSQVYPKTTTTYSDEYGKKVKDDYSYVEKDEQDKTYIHVYTDWYDDFWKGTKKDIYTYDVSNIELENIEDYLDLDYSELEANKETVSLKNGDSLSQKGYTEVEKISIDRSREESITSIGTYIAVSLVPYVIYICILLIIEFEMLNINNKRWGIVNNLYQLLKYDIRDYKKDKVKYKNKLQESKSYLNSLLEEINKYEELKLRFNELYNQNKYLLDDPEKLLSKIDTLSQELSKEDIKGKLKSLKRY